MKGFEKKKCRPCEGGLEPMGKQRAAVLLQQVPGWALEGGSRAIRRNFRFPGFSETVAFINALAWVAISQGHHPDFRAGYGYCKVTFTTHAIGGLSENDFICAARLNALAGV